MCIRDSRSPFNFSDTALEETRSSLKRLYTALQTAGSVAPLPGIDWAEPRAWMAAGGEASCPQEPRSRSPSRCWGVSRRSPGRQQLYRWQYPTAFPPLPSSSNRLAHCRLLHRTAQSPRSGRSRPSPGVVFAARLTRQANSPKTNPDCLRLAQTTRLGCVATRLTERQSWQSAQRPTRPIAGQRLSLIHI